jgi:hypothetical protein
VARSFECFEALSRAQGTAEALEATKRFLSLSPGPPSWAVREWRRRALPRLSKGQALLLRLKLAAFRPLWSLGAFAEKRANLTVAAIVLLAALGAVLKLVFQTTAR